MQDLQRTAFAFLLERGTVVFPLTAVVLLALAAAVLTRRGWNRWVPRGAVSLCVAMVVPCVLSFYFVRSVNAALAHRVGDFTFRLVSDDSVHRLSDYAGKTVVLNFWATWCGPCLKELAELERFAALRSVPNAACNLEATPR